MTEENEIRAIGDAEGEIIDDDLTDIFFENFRVLDRGESVEIGDKSENGVGWILTEGEKGGDHTEVVTEMHVAAGGGDAGEDDFVIGGGGGFGHDGVIIPLGARLITV